MPSVWIGCFISTNGGLNGIVSFVIMDEWMDVRDVSIYKTTMLRLVESRTTIYLMISFIRIALSLAT